MLRNVKHMEHDTLSLQKLVLTSNMGLFSKSNQAEHPSLNVACDLVYRNPVKQLEMD